MSAEIAVGTDDKKTGEDCTDEMVENIKERALTEHSRKVSQMAALKQDFGEFFDEESSKVLASGVMEEYGADDPRIKRPELCTDEAVNSIKEKAVAQHQHKSSIMHSLRHDFGDYFEEETADKLASHAFEDLGMDSKKPEQCTDAVADEIVERNLSKHSRKESLMTALTDDFSEFFDEEASIILATEILRERKPLSEGRRRRLSIDLNERGINTNNAITDSETDVATLQQQIREKNETILLLQDAYCDLLHSKMELALNANKAMNDLRGLITAYQKLTGIKLNKRPDRP